VSICRGCAGVCRRDSRLSPSRRDIDRHRSTSLLTGAFGDVRRVYELVPTVDTSVAPHAFVYVSDEGSLLYSGDAGYPTDLANASMMDRVWIDDRPHATRCVVDSAAVVAFDGTITWTTTSERFDPVVTVARARLRSL
jgi:hypothetical protein